METFTFIMSLIIVFMINAQCFSANQAASGCRAIYHPRLDAWLSLTLRAA